MKYKIFDLLVGSRCNNNCVFCVARYDNTKEYPEILNNLEQLRIQKLQVIRNRLFEEKTTKEITRKIQQVKKNGYEAIMFEGGESTIREDIFSLINYAREIGFKNIKILTNGRMLSYFSFCERLIRSGVQEFNLSLHGHNSFIHDTITRSRDSFNQSVRGIRNILFFSDISVSVTTVVCKLNHSYLNKIGKFLSNLGVKKWQIRNLAPEGKAIKQFSKLSIKPLKLSLSMRKILNISYLFEQIKLVDFPVCIFGQEYLKLHNRNINFMSLNETHVRLLEQEKVLFSRYKRYSVSTYLKKPLICKKCICTEYCVGVFGYYLDLYGDAHMKEFICLQKK